MCIRDRYTAFGELGVGSLRMVAATRGITIADGDVDELRQRMGTMPAHPDVAPALTRLRDAGFCLVTLTNSPSSFSPTPLERAGIGEFFERAFSVDAVRKFKPAPETYQHVATELGVKTSDLCLVACHLWDTVGAQAAGCHGALLTRPHNAILPAAGVPVPDFVASELGDLADQIVRRWKTVSYTHLDVYKRQHLPRPRPRGPDAEGARRPWAIEAFRGDPGRDSGGQA